MTFIRSWPVPALLVAALLAGCTGEDAPPPATHDAPQSAEDVPRPAEIAAIPPLEEERGSIVAPAPKAAPETPIPAIETLRGLEAGKVTLMLGEPQFQRIDSPAELWQYRLGGCVLDLFFYPSSSGEMAVDHLETRHFDNSTSDPQGCFTQLVRAVRHTG